MQGLSFGSLKKHPALVPLFFCVGFGAMTATLYTLRLAVKSPEVTWMPKTNTEPWNDYKEKQYKIISSNVDFKKVKSPLPEY
ncbi:hypothetical protein KM043_002992 [Ampulex compressa]|nr:hypothetical protein KM043_002992 [Ampulex compressa]